MRHRGYNIVDSPQAVVDLMSAGWGKLTKLGEATELATREGVYRKLVAQGMSGMILFKINKWVDLIVFNQSSSQKYLWNDNHRN